MELEAVRALQDQGVPFRHDEGDSNASQEGFEEVDEVGRKLVSLINALRSDVYVERTINARRGIGYANINSIFTVRAWERHDTNSDVPNVLLYERQNSRVQCNPARKV